MGYSWLWITAAALTGALVIALLWWQVHQRKIQPRRPGVDWTAAAAMELLVVVAAVEHLLLPAVLYIGPARARLLAALLPSAAVSVLGFATSIALLAAHRARPLSRPGSLLWRRIGVATPGLAGFIALTSASAIVVASVGEALTPAVIGVLAAPVLTALLGTLLASRLLAVALVPRQPEAAPPAESGPRKDAGNTVFKQDDTTFDGRAPTTWDPYRRPQEHDR